MGGGGKKDDSEDEEEEDSNSEQYKAPPLFEVRAVGNSCSNNAADSVADSPARNTRKRSGMVVADSGRERRKRGKGYN